MAIDGLVRVLLVEDDEEDYLLTAALFRRMRLGAYQLDWTSDPAEALADMRAQRHDVYLLDYRLGAVTGVELLRQVQSAGSSVLAIMLTGMGEEEADREALEGGAADYLEKDGLNAKTLERAIRYAMMQRRHEAALQRSHDELERAVAARTEELACANRALQEADRRKNEFLAVLAHELRNPLAPLRAATEVMKRSSPPDAQSRTLYDIVGRQTEHMRRLVDDLLDVSRIATGKIKLSPERVSVAEAVATAVEAASPLIEDKGHRLEVSLPEEPLHVHADKLRLAQVITNVLLNAAKYTDPGGEIRLEVSSGGPQVVLRISDTGVGIPPEMLARVFEPFVQLEGALDRAEGGLGVGLALVKTLTELHGGHVEAHSAGKGQGSVFTLTWPALEPAPLPLEAPPSVESRPRSLRVLVADDNTDAAETLRLLLELSGHEVRTAQDGLTAITVAEQFRPSLALVDIGMPVLNGYDTCRQIRGHAWGRKLVLVALTGWGTEDDRKRAFAAGFDHHMVKPIDFAALDVLLANIRPTLGAASSS
jgi:signal transduction histidine kinase